MGVTPVDEDCLYANVFTPPASGDQALPVMVYIHGGGFAGGSGQYSAQNLSSRGDVIVVTFNYRLNAFGFLASSAFGQASGDYGLEDQQAALRWVQRNIPSFGGDPHSVTIFGSSAGGSSVCMQLISPTSRGLFAKAIIESGHYSIYESGGSCSQTLPTLAQAEATGAQYATSLGCTDPATVAACLRSKPAADILAATASNPPVYPIINGAILTQQPQDAFAAGRFNHVPIINGVARDEGRTFVSLSFPNGAADLTASQFRSDISQKFGTAADKVLAAYPLSQYSSPRIALGAVWSDAYTVCPALRTDQLLSRWTPTFGYEFDESDTFYPLFQNLPNGAFHAAEDGYLRGSPAGTATTADELALQNQLMDEWAQFAYSGNPKANGTPIWPRLSPGEPQHVLSMVGGGDSQLTTDIRSDHQCGMWDEINSSQ